MSAEEPSDTKGWKPVVQIALVVGALLLALAFGAARQVLSILSLGFLIVVHEYGHYIVARWCGMGIERFSIGFGPGIFRRRSKKTGTVFQLAPIPFGGFVEIRGMNIAEHVDSNDSTAYPNRPAWQRFLTIFAGPGTNYLSAVVLALVLYVGHGVRSEWGWFGVAKVLEGYDAIGKLVPGDRILAVEHQPILAVGKYTLSDGTTVRADPNNGLLARVNQNKGKPVTLTVERQGRPLDVTIQPKRGKDKAGNSVYLLGIEVSLQADLVEVGVGTALMRALEYPVLQTQVLGTLLYGVVVGKEEADPGGPKRIYDEFEKAWELGWVAAVKLLMVLSVSIGLFNLLPLPALDGGRLVFLGYEMVTRRRANPRLEATIHMGGIMVLAVVMILVTLRDFHVF